MIELGPVLIANRGEIAIRIARSVRSLGLQAVGVHSVADAANHVPHPDAMDVSVPVGSYLDPEEIVRAARLSGARSVHPGYGFLSESPRLAEAVAEAGLRWIGPPVAAIEAMADKGRAKEMAEEAGVPVVPAADPGDPADYPVVVKALAGGGGKGMRVVHSPDAFEAAREAAIREAEAAFGDGRVLVERYIERPRHIEIQVLADAHGGCVHLGERECSLQRRHQKVVEEAPSPVVGPELREQMGAAAVKLALACGYEGAGTVELVTDGDVSSFYFLEMNTRLQVEHPVSELVYGVDLVEQQLRIAAGERLAIAQAQVQPSGHAIEARLYAEDPAAGFLPSVGTVRVYREPGSADPGIRLDSGVREGTVVGTDYDPMLAKLIAHGPDREAALMRLDRALADLDLVGVRTNAAFTRELLGREDVRAGDVDTGLLERILDEPGAEAPGDLLPAAVLAAAGTAQPAGPWRRLLEGHGEARIESGRLTVGEREWRDVGVRRDAAGDLRITVGGAERRYATAIEGKRVWIARDGYQLEVGPPPRGGGAAALAEGALEAPMPGTVLLVNVADGDAVAEGDVLLVLESMKMEMPIVAPRAGLVSGLELRVGDKVAVGAPLLALSDEAADRGGASGASGAVAREQGR